MPVKCFLLALAVLCVAPVDVPCQDASNNAATIVYDDDATLPSMELLEFLAEFESEDGEWLDPLLLDEMRLSEQESSDE
jgi:hypothetical protein